MDPSKGALIDPLCLGDVSDHDGVLGGGICRDGRQIELGLRELEAPWVNF